LIRVDTGATLNTGSDTFAVVGGTEELYFISPAITYIGLCRVTFSGEGASASQLFYTEETVAGPPGPPGGTGGTGPAPSARDSDGDGLTDAEEEFYGTDPNNADTDGDGFSDYVEIISGTDPLDPTSHPAAVESFIYFLIGITAFAFILVLLYFLVYKKKKEKERNQRKRKISKGQR